MKTPLLNKGGLCLISIWIGVMLMGTFVQTSQADVIDVLLGTKGPACPLCNAYIEGKLKHVPGLQKVITNLKYSTFTLIPKQGQPLDVLAIKNAVKDSGYDFGYIKLTLSGLFTDSNGKAALKEPTADQVFLLVQGENKLPLSQDKLMEIKSLSDNGAKQIEVKGMAYSGEGMALLEPTQVSAVQPSIK
jgi:copper chaperone CopZ